MSKNAQNRAHFEGIKSRRMSEICQIIAVAICFPLIYVSLQAKWGAVGLILGAQLTLFAFSYFLKSRGIYNIGSLVISFLLGSIVFFRCLQGGGIEATSTFWFVAVVASGLVFLRKKQVVILTLYVILLCGYLFAISKGVVPNWVETTEEPLFLRYFDVVCNILVLCGLFFINNEIFAEQMSIIRNQENALLLQSRLKSMGEMAAGIAHEVNNPLAIILGSAQAIDISLQGEPIQRDKVTKYNTTIIKTVGRISAIIGSLKKLSHGDVDSDFESVSIEDLYFEVTNIVSSKALDIQAEITFHKLTKNIYVQGSFTLLGQILLNLITNSLQAIQDLPERWINVQCTVQSGVVKISVTDSGGGISKEQIEKIFEPFYTTKRIGEGTGLGLSLCKTAIARMNGRLFVNRDSQNTEFVMELAETIPPASLKSA